MSKKSYRIFFIEFCKEKDIELHYIQPGKPAQNAYIRASEPYLYRGCLDAYVFDSIAKVNSIAYQWQIDYNGNHPHKSLNGLSPWLFAKNP